jgi:hypothetical protein
VPEIHPVWVRPVAPPRPVPVPQPPRLRPELGPLGEKLAAVCASAVDPLEIAAAVEAEGLNDQMIRIRYGYQDVFALADELWLGPRSPAEPEPQPDPWRAEWTRNIAHALLYGLPAICFPAAAGLLTGRAALTVLIVSMLTSWALSQGLAHLGYARFGRLDPDGAKHLLAAGMAVSLVVVGAAMNVLSFLVDASAGSLWFGFGQGAYMIGAAVLMVTGADRLLLLCLAPAVLGSAGYLLLGRPAALEHPVWFALAATPLLTLVLVVLRFRGTAPATGPLFRGTEIRAALPSAGFGLLAAALMAFPLATGALTGTAVRDGLLLAALPLSLSMGAAEGAMLWYRRRSQRLLRGSEQLRGFTRRAHLVLAGAVLQYLTAGVLLVAAVTWIATATHLIRPQWTMAYGLATYLLLGAAMFLALLLQTFGSRILPLVACLAALAAEFLLRGYGITGQLAICAALFLVLGGYAGSVLGRAVRHAY